MVLARLAKAPRRTLLPLLPLLLLSAAAGSVRATGLDAVEEHSNVGVEMDEDMLARPEDAPQGVWRQIVLNPPMSTVDTYTPPEYLVDERVAAAAGGPPHVYLRGWAQAQRAVRVGQAMFVLPREAWPGREERFRVSFKGTNREVVVGTDGVARATLPLDKALWMPLAGFSYAGAGEAGLELGDGTDDRASEPAREEL